MQSRSCGTKDKSCDKFRAVVNGSRKNPRVPIRALPGLEIARQGMTLLQSLDFDMREGEQTRESGEPVVRVGIGFYRFEEPDEEPLSPKREMLRPQINRVHEERVSPANEL